MHIGQSLPPSFEEVQNPPIRYYQVPTDNRSFYLKELNSDEAYLVQNFECVEELVARGADSARIAISQCPPPEGPLPGYSQLALGSPLVPASPFSFDQSIVIVLPTYNERSNLEALVNAIGQYLIADVLIVDDNSPDGTGQLADQLSCRYGRSTCCIGQENKGLGQPIWRGLNGRSNGSTTVSSKWIVISVTHLGTYPAWSTVAEPPTWLSAVATCMVGAPTTGTLGGAWCLAAATPMCGSF
jgi:hypothetical protein